MGGIQQVNIIIITRLRKAVGPLGQSGSSKEGKFSSIRWAAPETVEEDKKFFKEQVIIVFFYYYCVLLFGLSLLIPTNSFFSFDSLYLPIFPLLSFSHACLRTRYT